MSMGVAVLGKSYGGAGNRKQLGRRKRAKSVDPVDRGTPELAAKRAHLVRGGDPAMSTCVIDVMRARDAVAEKDHPRTEMLFTERRYLGAATFANLRYRLFGVGVPSVAQQPGAEMTEATETALRKRYEDADEALARAGDAVRLETRRVVIHNNWPRWFLTGQPSKRRERLARGLDVLAKAFGR